VNYLFSIVVVAIVLAFFGLASYAMYLYLQLRKQKGSLEESVRQQRIACEAQVEEAQKGIVILARALVRNELSLTEGCIRISFLMGKARSAYASDVGQEPYSEDMNKVFFQLAEATAHIPVLDEWRKLTLEKQQSYDREREHIEDKFREFVFLAASALLEEK